MPKKLRHVTVLILIGAVLLFFFWPVLTRWRDGLAGTSTDTGAQPSQGANVVGQYMKNPVPIS